MASRKVLAAPALARLEVARDLREVVLLAGTVRPRALQTDSGRSTLDLPLTAGQTILNHWQDQVRQLARQLHLPRLPIRVMLDAHSPAPQSAQVDETAPVTIEKDPLDLRGTAGVLHDLASRFHDRDALLVASAKQVLMEELDQLVHELAQTGADASLIAHEDGVPCGLMLLRCGCLRDIPRIGFVDLKEQALPRIALQHEVSVVRRHSATGLPTRSLTEYLHALRLHGRRIAPDHSRSGPLALIEPGAQVHPSACLHHAVVLRGAVIEQRAIVARSLICGDAVVPHDTVIVDRVYATPGTSPRKSNARANAGHGTYRTS